MEDNVKTIKQIIDEKGFYACVPHGYSMYPMLRNLQDVMYIVKPPEGRLKKYDAALFYRPKDGHHVLHRVLKVREDDYLFCGDNQFVLEPVKDEQIIGILQSFYRGDKLISCNDFWYKIYVHLWCRSLKLRKILKWLYIHLGEYKRKICKVLKHEK